MTDQQQAEQIVQQFVASGGVVGGIREVNGLMQQLIATALRTERERCAQIVKAHLHRTPEIVDCHCLEIIVAEIGREA